MPRFFYPSVWQLRFIFRYLLLLLLLSSLLFLFLTTGRSAGSLNPKPSESNPVRAVAARALQQFGARSYGAGSELPDDATTTVTTARNYQYTEILKDPKHSKLSRRSHFVKRLKEQMRNAGSVPRKALPFQQLSGANLNKTIVKEEDIKKTLLLVDQRLGEGRKVLSVETSGSTFGWNTSHPQQILLITSWRSGSTFLGEILSSHPGVFNHYEPLMHFGIKQIRNGTDAEKAVEHLRNLLQCSYRDEEYLKNVKEMMIDMVSHNTHVWDACLHGPNRNTCSNRTFLENACQKFPIITMKIVRLRLALVESLLRDPSLSRLKVVYLVRDPRGTLNSRWGSVKWCSKSPDCAEPSKLCGDIDEDLNAFEELSIKYPGQLVLLKYENLAADPHTTLGTLFEFCGLLYTKQIRESVQRHTSRDENRPWSTVRKSTERVNLWKQKLTKDKIRDIENHCQNVIDRLGYPIS